MSMFQTLPAIAAAGFAAGGLFVGLTAQRTFRGAWIVPALLSALFLGWSIFTFATEGPYGFWPNHTTNAWGNQVWFDLLLGVGTAYALLVRDARAVGMRPLPWFALILCTGSIGLLAMVSRYQFLKEKELHA